MAAEFTGRLRAVDGVLLTPLVRTALGDAAAEITAIKLKPLSGGFAGGTVGGHGTYRFSGTAQVAGGARPWSLILKVLGRTEGTGSTDPREWNYWKREILAYQSGLLAALPEGIAAPRCFGVVEYPGEEFWIWLEDVADAATDHWQMADYARVAKHIGRFNGSYLAGEPLPDRPWFTRGRVRNWLDLSAEILNDLPAHLQSRTRRHWLTPQQAGQVEALWHAREPLLQVLEGLPKTLCHHDAFKRNLFAGADRTTAIDWQIMGLGAIGEDIMPLVAVSVQFMHQPASAMAELEGNVLAGYVAGLRDAGWQGDELLPRLGYALAASLWGGVSTVGMWPEVSDAREYRSTEKIIGAPIDSIVDCWGDMQTHYLKLAGEAEALRQKLGV